MIFDFGIASSFFSKLLWNHNKRTGRECQ